MDQSNDTRTGFIYFPLVLLLLVLLPIFSAHSQHKPKTFKLNPEDHFLVDTDVGTCACVKNRSTWASGIINSRKNTYRLHNLEIRRLKSLFDSSLDLKIKKRTKRQRQLLIKQRNNCLPLCRVGPPPTPTPPSGSPTPTPTAAPTPCYDINRNTSCFGIPNGFVGNEAIGQTLWAIAPGCVGCHGPGDVNKRNRSFEQIQNALATIPEMGPVECDVQCIADLVAYLNRYNLNQ